MKAMILRKVVSPGETNHPLTLVDVPAPVPGRGELLQGAGAIGYRSLSLARLRDGEGLGLTGFGGSEPRCCCRNEIDWQFSPHWGTIPTRHSPTTSDASPGTRQHPTAPAHFCELRRTSHGQTEHSHLRH